jgi:hypothetical protein
MVGDGRIRIHITRQTGPCPGSNGLCLEISGILARLEALSSTFLGIAYRYLSIRYNPTAISHSSLHSLALFPLLVL